MPLARTNSRGAFLNCRFAVNGIQKASRLLAMGAVCNMVVAPPRNGFSRRPLAGFSRQAKLD
jgi:hypothetical protein